MDGLKAIIFDMDGTLADTEEIHRQAFNQAFSEFELGWHWSKQDYIQQLHVSGGKERIRLGLLNDPEIDVEHERAWEMAERIHSKKSEIYRQKLIDGHIRLRPGVERLINEAKNKEILLAIATSSSSKNVATLLESNLGKQALSLFETIVTCDIVEDKKPSPAVYQYALAQMGLEAQDCIAIEDTYNGNLSALNTGIKTVITIHDFTVQDDFTGASLVIDNLGEPGQAFTVIDGNDFGKAYVDTALLQLIHRAGIAENGNEEWPGDLAAVMK